MSSAVRYSPVHEALAKRNPQWGEIESMPTALSFTGVEQERSVKEQLSICDLSALTRFGLKGPSAPAVLQERGIEVPQQINRWLPLSGDGGIVMRVGTNEFLLEDGLTTTIVRDLQDSVGSGQEGVYPVLRQEAALALTGSRAREVMLQSCGLDFDAVDYDERPIFFTRVALISVLVLPQVEGGIPTFRIWCEYPYGMYLWVELEEMVEEYGGGVIGLSAYFGDG